MNFKCPGCGQKLRRDMRRTESKNSMSKRGYRTYCDTKDRFYFIVIGKEPNHAER
jgi:hypothetical protein